MLKMTISQGKEKPLIIFQNGTQKVLPAELLGQEFILVPLKKVEPAVGPVEWTWNDGQGSRDRQARCLIVVPTGDVHRFSGVSITGVVKVLGSDYTKNGKWSNSTYRCISPAGTVPVSWMQDWETGATFPQDTWQETLAWLLAQAPNADFDSFEKMLRAEFPKTSDKFDSNREAIKEFS